ncbi:MAG: hypothetical protein E8D52_16755 [Nitrospira sp.]|nr:MAG: hypothetical protein E8D52_16755 [Nitrospira sp.]
MRRYDAAPLRRGVSEFKRQAVQFIHASQRSVVKTARELDIPRNRFYKW